MGPSSVSFMTEMVLTIDEAPGADAGDGVDDVFGLGAEDVLRTLVAERETQERAAARELRGVTAWADLHRISDPSVEGLGSVDPDVETLVVDEDLRLTRYGMGRGFAGPGGIEGILRLAGQGAYQVREFAVTELAAALGMSETAARAYVSQALELRDRLPRLWSRVMKGDLPAWKARRVAERTIPLGDEAVGWVDAQLAPFAHKLSLRRLELCVEAAVIRFEPDVADEEARQASELRKVRAEHFVDGTSQITAVTSTPDALAFEHAVSEVASGLAALGDLDQLQVRRAKAVGVLADPQYALDLALTVEGAEIEDPGLLGPRRPNRSGSGPQGAAPEVHLHVHTAVSEASVLGRGGGTDDGTWMGPLGPVVRVDAPGVHGPRHLTAVEQWLRDVAPGAVVKITPVVDLRRHLVADAYEVPVALNRQVGERDLACQFPWCGRRGRRYDHDHIEEYVDPDEGGPPAQTSSANIARLCRYHHRVKTHASWTYRREPDDTLLWVSPRRRHYAVDPAGTTTLR